MSKSISFVLGVLICISTVGFAQAQLSHPYKLYQAPDGKIFMQKSLPVYLYLSTQPNGKGEMVQLQSDSTKAFANPMYMDTEGYNTFRSPSAVDTTTREIHYPLTDVVFEVYSDSRSPKTRMKYDLKKKYYNGQKLFIGSNLEVTLEASDEQSGVEQVLVSVDSAGYTKYQQAIVFNQEKKYDLNYYAVDNVGNAENVNHFEFYVDLTPPTNELVFDGNKFENNISGQTLIKIVANDINSGLSKTYYSIDSKKYLTYSYPLKAAYLSEGEHTIKYYSVDNVGNETSEEEYTFFVDKTAPILVDEIIGNSFIVNGKEYSSGRTKLKLTAVDNKSGVKEIKYSINNEEYINYEKPFYLTSVSGSLSVISYAVDQVGNKSVASEKSTRNRAAYVDLTGPQLKYNVIGKSFKTRDTLFINKDSKIKLSAIDPESGLKTIAYSINEGAETPYSEPFSLVEEGVKLLSIYGYDNVDNSNRTQLNIVIDNVGPDIFSRFSILPINQKMMNDKQVDVYSSHVVLFLSATDAKVAIDKIYYSVNDEPEKLYTGVVEGFKRGMNYTIKIKAYDKLGNSNEDEVMFATDNTGPQIFARFSVPSLSSEEIDGEVIDIFPSHVSLFISVTNAYVAYDKIYYSINGSPEKIYHGIIDGFKADTDVKMNIRAVDRLGNQTDKLIHFKVVEE